MMTALAMIVGMLPMSLGLGEGGEQNAPLGRAVIGGLLVATFFTLFFVPVMYSLLRRLAPRPETENDGAAAAPTQGKPAGRQWIALKEDRSWTGHCVSMKAVPPQWTGVRDHRPPPH